MIDNVFILVDKGFFGKVIELVIDIINFVKFVLVDVW